MTQEINREEREDKLFLFALNNLDGKIYRDKEDGPPALDLPACGGTAADKC